MRVSSYLFLIAGLMMLFNLAGLTTTAGYILTQLDIVNNPENFALTSIVGIVAAVFVSAAIGGVVIGFLTRTSPESYLLAGYSSVLILFLADLIVIVSNASSFGQTWAYWLVILICMPVAIGYIHAIASWWGGKQS